MLLPVVVFDKKGRFVDGLQKKDFRVRVETTGVEIDTFDRDDNAPVSMAFLVDTSGSMELAAKLTNAKRAIRSIVQGRLPGDDFALFAFSEGEVKLIADFSANSRKSSSPRWMSFPRADRPLCSTRWPRPRSS